jgi:hypothetical protein
MMLCSGARLVTFPQHRSPAPETPALPLPGFRFSQTTMDIPPGWDQPHVDREGQHAHEPKPRLQSTSGVARQVDKLQHRAVGIVKIGAWAVEHAALPILLNGDLDVVSA